MIKLDLSSSQLLRLKQLSDTGNDNIFRFLAFSLNLETGEFHDTLQEGSSRVIEYKNPTMHQQISDLLSNYALSNKKSRGTKLVKFKDFPGGYAYENAFIRRAIEPIVKVFGKQPDELIEAAKLLGGNHLEYGRSSAEIPALSEVPLTYILWTDEELPASANILFDENAGSFLNVEDLATLADLTSWRLSIAQSMLGRSNSFEL